MAGVRDHTELDVWKLCMELGTKVSEILDRPAFRAWPGLQDQLRRSTERPAPNIAEGFSRYHPSENAPFVRIAKGSLGEAIEHLRDAHDKKLIEREEWMDLTRLAKRARGAVTKYVVYLESASAPGTPRRARRR